MTHSFSVADAEKYGLTAAVVLNLIRGWVAYNKAGARNQRDGRTWTYNSVKGWSKLLPYLTAKQIRTAIDDLVEAGAVIKGKFNENAYDHTLWYAVPDESTACPVGQNAMPGEAFSLASEGKRLDQEKNQGDKPNGKKTKEDEVTLESIAFVEAFLTLLKETGSPITAPTTAARVKWADAYEKLVRLDGKTKGEIWRVCVWARNDAFWKGNFFSPVKLRDRKDGVSYFDKFAAKMNSPLNGNSTTSKPNGRGLGINSNLAAYDAYDRASLAPSS